MIDRLVDMKVAVLAGIATCFASLAPIQALLSITTAFVICDFVSSIIAYRKSPKGKRNSFLRSLREVGERYLYIALFSVMIISLSYILGTKVLPLEFMNIEKAAASSVCVFSLVSIIKNAAFITKSKAFSSINNFVKVRFPETTK